MNAHTDARTRFVIADRPQTIVWAGVGDSWQGTSESLGMPRIPRSDRIPPEYPYSRYSAPKRSKTSKMPPKYPKCPQNCAFGARIPCTERPGIRPARSV
jgi:hypothetical protein